MDKAKYILYNGRFYISNEGREYAEACAIGGKKLLRVGTLEECEVFKDDETEAMDMGGRLILPGLIDGHTHPETIAKSRWRVQMPEFDSKEELLEFVRNYCDEHPVEETPYFFGECYPSTMFDENGPRKEWIDEYVSDRPVRLQDFTDHACWYNSKALELMGITADRPERGIAPFYQRDEDGEPTGWVLEPVPTGMDEEVMFDKIGWHPPTSVTEETITPFLDFLKDYGVIGILDGITEGEEAMKLFYQMDIAGKLNMYYEGACMLEEYSKLDECISEIRKWQKHYTSEHVRIHTMKLFLDQTNEMGTGASLEPHKNDPQGRNFGELNMSEKELTEVLVRLNDKGIDMHIHVVCDRGFRTACNAYENAKAEVAASGKPWRIYMELAHCELVHPDDMARPAKLGIIINWSTHWAGGYFGEAAIEYLGRKRWDTMYDMTGFIETGAVVTYSSDVIGMCEEHRGNPFFGMQISATRVDIDDPLDSQRYPGSVRPPESAKLPVEEMIRGYTRYGAIPLRLEDRTGTLEEGMMANLVVLDKNIFEIPATEIHTVKPQAVMFEGEFIRTPDNRQKR